MFTKSSAIKIAVAAAVVAGSALAVGPAGATGVAVTKAGPKVLAKGVASVVAIDGTGFTSAISGVQFSDVTTCTGTNVFVHSSKRIYVMSPTSATCPVDTAVKIVLFTGNTVTATLNPNAKGDNVPKFVVPVDASTATFTPASGIGGTKLAVALDGLPEKFSATLGGRAVGSIKKTPTGFTGVVPAGVTPGTGKLVVTAAGVSGAPSTAGFTFRSAIKVSPNTFVKGADAPVIKITGLGFKPTLTKPNATHAAPVVEVCGVAATLSLDPKKAYTDNTIYATVPDFTAAGAGTSDFGNVDATNGGACVVQVKIDKDGTGGDGDVLASAVGATEDSIVTGSAGFVYLPF